MKKIYLTLFLLLFSTSAFAFDVCEHEKKYSQIWYVNNCGGETLVIKKEKRKNSDKNTPWKGYENCTSSEIPWDANPDYKILKKYLKKYINEPVNEKNKIVIKKSKNYKEFTFNLTEDEKVTKAFQKTALLSYLMY